MSVYTLQTIDAGIRAAREDRVKFQAGTAEYKMADDNVQALKAEKARLQNLASQPQVKTPAVAKPQSKPSVLIALPAFPQLYSVLAFQHYRMMNPSVVMQVAFSHKSTPTAEDIKLWQGACGGGQKPVLVDLAEKAEKGYACVNANALPQVSSYVGGAAIFSQLLKPETARAGWQARYSIAKILNDVYFLGGEDTEQKIFDRAMDVVKTCLLGQNGRAWNTLTKGSYKKDLEPLWQGFNVTEAEVVPLTIQHYFKNLFCAGVARPEIQEKVGWWIARYKALARKKEEKKDLAFRPFMIQGLPAGFVCVANYWEGNSFQFQFLGNAFLKLAILRSPKGHVVFYGAPKHRSVDLTRLYQRLSADEPGRWKMRGDRVLANGGFRFDGDRPTSKDSEALRGFAAKYVNLR